MRIGFQNQTDSETYKQNPKQKKSQKQIQINQYANTSKKQQYHQRIGSNRKDEEEEGEG